MCPVNVRPTSWYARLALMQAHPMEMGKIRALLVVACAGLATMLPAGTAGATDPSIGIGPGAATDPSIGIGPGAATDPSIGIGPGAATDEIAALPGVRTLDLSAQAGPYYLYS